MQLVTTIDCGSINTFDTSACSALNNMDSVAYVNSFLGSWYLSASQNSGFGGGNTDCINYTEAESPYKFTFNSDYTWRLIQTDPPVDTTMGWVVVSGFAGLRVSSNLCDGDLVTDLRPVDGPLRVYSKID